MLVCSVVFKLYSAAVTKIKELFSCTDVGVREVDEVAKVEF